jgi:hypothetical protein
MTWSIFFKICDKCELQKFQKLVFLRVFLTIFVLGLTFLATKIYFVNFDVGNVNIMELLLTSLMPLIPKIVETISSKMSDLEQRILENRFDFQLYEFEKKYCPTSLPYSTYPSFVILDSGEIKSKEMPDELRPKKNVKI